MKTTILAVAVGVLLATPLQADVEQKYAPIYYDTDYPGVFAIKGAIGYNAALKFEEAIVEFGTPKRHAKNLRHGFLARRAKR